MYPPPPRVQVRLGGLGGTIGETPQRLVFLPVVALQVGIEPLRDAADACAAVEERVRPVNERAEFPPCHADCCSGSAGRLGASGVANVAFSRRFGIASPHASDRTWAYAGIAAALAVAGWVWAFSDGMPDALWLLTVALTVIAIALAAYALIRGRGRGADASFR